MRWVLRRIEAVLWLLAPFSLIVAAVTSSKLVLPICGVVFLLSIVIVVPLHFYRAWRRLNTVPNRRQYAAWVGFESLATIALIALAIWGLFSK
jgi:hypothetical protein